MTVVELADYLCPFCRHFASTAAVELSEAFVSTGRVRWVFAPVILSDHSLLVTAAAECANRLGHFWSFHDAVFSVPPAAPDVMIEAAAQRTGLDAVALRLCAAPGGAAAVAVGGRAEETLRLGIWGTPTFLIGPTEEDAVTVEEALVGAATLDEFAGALRRALEQR